MNNQIKITYHEAIAHCQVASDEHPYLERGFVENLKEIAEEINQNSTIKVVIFKGGMRNFCLGGSHHALTGEGHLEALPFYVADIPRLILSIKVPTIACMVGHALGGGLLLGLWCDLVALCESSLYGANFMSLGFTPGMGGTVVMEEAFGPFLARRLLYTGKLVKGREIRNMSCPISASVFDRDNVEGRCLEWADEMAHLPAVSTQMLKDNQNHRRKIILEEGLKEEQRMHQDLFSRQEIQQFIIDHHQQAKTP